MCAPLTIPSLDWLKGNGLLPVIVQDAATLRVLMLGYMNEEALAATQSTGLVTFYSRSKQRLWQKGETSGNALRVVDIQADCDADTLLILAEPNGPTCHTGSQSCFGDKQSASLSILADLEKTIQERKAAPQEGSYTCSLFKEGLPRIAQKVGEEGVEVALAGALQAPNLCEEAADLLYHLLVLFAAREIPFRSALKVLNQRHSACCK